LDRDPHADRQTGFDRKDWMERTQHGRSAPIPTVVGIMDRDSWNARTDNIVVVDPRKRRLTWIPRDLWSAVADDRINEAFARGGHDVFQAAIRQIGLPARASLVVLRTAVERFLSGLRITIPVDRPRRYWYPMAPTLRLQDGAKLVGFDPPYDVLEGERIHQWIGARSSADTPAPRLPDLDRIARQQVFLRRLLEDGHDFAPVVADAALASVSDAGALDQLGRVRPDWDFRTFDRVEPRHIDGKHVLVRRRLLRWWPWENR
jgi:hypothetical protein